MLGGAWRLGRIAGVEVRVDSSWVIIAVLVTYSLYLQFNSAFEQLRPAAALLLAIVFAILFFSSVLFHEMAHAVTARRRGIPVRGITLFLFGGATHAKVEARGPRDELVISVVGPLSSLALAAVFFLVGTALRPAIPPVGGGLRYLGLVNLALAVFNMVPGFPLDGGRVLRSLIWKATGSLSRATRIASIAGQVVGFLIIGIGVFFLTRGVLVSAIWLGSIGWFLVQAARTSYEEVQVRRLLESVDADDVMTPELVSIPADLTLREAVDRFFMRYDHSAFPVEDRGSTVGLLTLRAVKREPTEEWGVRHVGEAMERLGEQISVAPDTRMDRVLAKLQDREGRRVLVVRDGDVIGIITASDIARWLERRRTLSG